MNSVQIYYQLFILICCCKILKTWPTNYDSYSTDTVKKVNETMKMILRNDLQILPTSLSDIDITHNEDVTANITKNRVKRDATGAGKFVEAAQMPQIKLVRLFLQMFKNLWDPAYVGGTHPLHPNIPKIFVQLYKQKIVEFFIPDVGQENRGY